MGDFDELVSAEFGDVGPAVAEMAENRLRIKGELAGVKRMGDEAALAFLREAHESAHMALHDGVKAYEDDGLGHREWLLYVDNVDPQYWINACVALVELVVCGDPRDVLFYNIHHCIPEADLGALERQGAGAAS